MPVAHMHMSDYSCSLYDEARGALWIMETMMETDIGLANGRSLGLGGNFSTIACRALQPWPLGSVEETQEKIILPHVSERREMRVWRSTRWRRGAPWDRRAVSCETAFCDFSQT